MKKSAQSTRPIKRKRKPFEISRFAEKMVKRMMVRGLNDIRTHGPWRPLARAGWEGWLQADLFAKDDQRKTGLVVAVRDTQGPIVYCWFDPRIPHHHFDRRQDELSSYATLERYMNRSGMDLGRSNGNLCEEDERELAPLGISSRSNKVRHRRKKR